ncbi:MAG: hypothetical protein RL065_187, partial [Bacteroidota bacterium]
MKKTFLSLTLLLLVSIFVDNQSLAQVSYKWTQKTSMPSGRAGAAAFTVRNSAYVG